MNEQRRITRVIYRSLALGEITREEANDLLEIFAGRQLIYPLDEEKTAGGRRDLPADHSQRIRTAMDRVRRSGKHVGRPKKKVRE